MLPLQLDCLGWFLHAFDHIFICIYANLLVISDEIIKLLHGIKGNLVLKSLLRCFFRTSFVLIAREITMLSSFHFKNDDDNNKFTYIESIKSFKDNAQSNTHPHTKYNLLILM